MIAQLGAVPSDRVVMRVDPSLSAELRDFPNNQTRSQPNRVMNEPRVALDAEHAQVLLARAWESVVGGPAPPQGVLLLTAQWALETDCGRSMPGHNFAGIKAARSAPGASFRTVEGYGASRREVTARFRVYDSAELGARDYVRLLASRYPAALAAARDGNTSAFSRSLAAGGYFTADPCAYERGLEQHLLALQGGAVPAKPANGSALVSEGALWGLLRALCRDPEEA
ncbi:MAG TPA: glucosaminidase domain-containing protein [Polyangiaceae bacterium]|jgi:hypothetical protein|nr:glucosaminidase domain-containing protein [Polyangiaceae bacterium]